ncbi:unnamed protein product [Vitrella brassicaformis CCMP3155]|uniref:AP2/ERF domain-containing protein n=1 Tax=Vitrella brassicaformis (strain CCMP3155) TaxID=1169540 RepID=A0A0G4FSJ0_VITBC|nr:unnamed protein product [Vitrella brassicaformis CCMP3155]|eukprot:CEM17398.1 unnamed protein product [Vitrella brassicaformis CCMP3155]
MQNPTAAHQPSAAASVAAMDIEQEGHSPGGVRQDSAAGGAEGHRGACDGTAAGGPSAAASTPTMPYPQAMSAAATYPSPSPAHPNGPPSQQDGLLEQLRQVLYKRGDPTRTTGYHPAYQEVQSSVRRVDGAKGGAYEVLAGPFYDSQGELFADEWGVTRDSKKGWLLGDVTQVLERVKRGGPIAADEPFEVRTSHHRARRYLMMKPTVDAPKGNAAGPMSPSPPPPPPAHPSYEDIGSANHTKPQPSGSGRSVRNRAPSRAAKKRAIDTPSPSPPPAAGPSNHPSPAAAAVGGPGDERNTVGQLLRTIRHKQDPGHKAYSAAYEGMQFSAEKMADGRHFLVTGWPSDSDADQPLCVRAAVYRDSNGTATGWELWRLTDMLAVVRAGSVDTDERFEIVTAVVAGEERQVVQWRAPQRRKKPAVSRPPKHKKTASPCHDRGPGDRRKRPLSRDPSPLPSLDGDGDGRDGSLNKSRPLKRQRGPHGRGLANRRPGHHGAHRELTSLDGLCGDELARMLMRRMREEQPNDFHAPDRGEIGITWRTNYTCEAYFWDNDASTTVGLRQFPVGYGASRAAIFTAFREAVEYRNALHRSRVGDRAMAIDLSWLQQAQQGQGQMDGGMLEGQFDSSPPPQRRKRTKRPSDDPPLDPSPPSRPPRSIFPHLPARPPGPREGDEGDATRGRDGRQRNSAARASRQSDSCDDGDDGSSSSSPQPRRRPKAAKRDGVSAPAGDVPSSIYASNPEWAADTDKKASTKSKTIITKSEHQSDVTGVTWQESHQAWKAQWYEKGDRKLKQKLFYVRDHGYDRAKALAEEHRRELERTGQAAVRKRSEHQSGVKGVYYHKASNSWMASWREGGKEKTKPFSVRQLGYEGAKQAAIAHRRAMEEGHYTFKDKAAKED